MSIQLIPMTPEAASAYLLKQHAIDIAPTQIAKRFKFAGVDTAVDGKYKREELDEFADAYVPPANSLKSAEQTNYVVNPEKQSKTKVMNTGQWQIVIYRAYLHQLWHRWHVEEICRATGQRPLDVSNQLRFENNWKGRKPCTI